MLAKVLVVAALVIMGVLVVDDDLEDDDVGDDHRDHVGSRCPRLLALAAPFPPSNADFSLTRLTEIVPSQLREATRPCDIPSFPFRISGSERSSVSCSTSKTEITHSHR